MSWTVLATPVGELLLRARDGALELVGLPRQDGTVARPTEPEGEDPVLGEAAAQLAAYFAGRRTTFELPLALDGTAFQRRVWTALADVPYGTTTTYTALAQRIGTPGAVRAVGRANGANPLPIVLPCHRVIGADGTLTGYAGGLALKQRLLELEGALLHVRELRAEPRRSPV